MNIIFIKKGNYLMLNTELLIEYESIMVGKRDSYATLYFKKDDPESDAIALLRYALLEVLNWTADMIIDYATPKLLDVLNLSRPIAKLSWPSEFDHDEDMFFIAWKIDPQKIKYSQKDFVLNIYARILEGKRQKFPKNFFGGVEGEYNSELCLQYIINQKLAFNTVEDMYAFFAEDKKSLMFLVENSLDSPVDQTFSSPLEYLHESLPNFQKNEFYYHYYDFVRSFRGYNKFRKPRNLPKRRQKNKK